MEQLELLDIVLPFIITILEIMGTIIIIIAALKSFLDYCKNFSNPKYEEIKLNLAKALALALEFKLGAEILKTVLIRSMEEIYILAAIILLRTILTFVIHWEIKSASQAESKKSITNKETKST